MRTKIESDGEDFFVPIPAETLAQAGSKPGQLVEITVSENTIILGAASEEPSDSHLKRLVALVHSEALELFEGDAGAKLRWMTLPQAGVLRRQETV